MVSRSLAQIQTNTELVEPSRRAGEEQEFEIAPGVKIVMCWIPPGEFLMGSPEDEPFREDNERQHLVTITQGFWLGKYPVTQAQWEAVMGSNPSHFRGSNLPVESVSWNDVSQPKGFLERVNLHAGASGIFLLPTEAQWEYACRAGTTTALNSGKNLTADMESCPNLDEVAWYRENSGITTHPVGQKKANAWGLHDMHGNVWEWCADWDGKYVDGTLVDPRGPESGSNRVVRGGSWNNYAGDCRVAGRNYFIPSISYLNFGFRMARSSIPK
jgi:formylglycine-generating enzyme required for sulfatase activity